MSTKTSVLAPNAPYRLLYEVIDPSCHNFSAVQKVQVAGTFYHPVTCGDITVLHHPHRKLIIGPAITSSPSKVYQHRALQAIAAAKEAAGLFLTSVSPFPVSHLYGSFVRLVL